MIHSARPTILWTLFSLEYCFVCQILKSGHGPICVKTMVTNGPWLGVGRVDQYIYKLNFRCLAYFLDIIAAQIRNPTSKSEFFFMQSIIPLLSLISIFYFFLLFHDFWLRKEEGLFRALENYDDRLINLLRFYGNTNFIALQKNNQNNREVFNHSMIRPACTIVLPIINKQYFDLKIFLCMYFFQRDGRRTKHKQWSSLMVVTVGRPSGSKSQWKNYSLFSFF